MKDSALKADSTLIPDNSLEVNMPSDSISEQVQENDLADLTDLADLNGETPEELLASLQASVETGLATVKTVKAAEQLELLDILDETGLPTGEQKTRLDIHKEGLWHRSIHLWIVKENRYVLLQRRSRLKDLEGGMIDVSVGGHFAAGESFVDVLREAEEEVGLSVSPADLTYLHTQKAELYYADAENTDQIARIDREFQEVYFCQCDQDLNQYFLNPEEVDIIYEVPLDAAIALYEEGEPVLAAGYDSQSRNNNAMLIEDDLIGKARANTLNSLKAIKAALSQVNQSNQSNNPEKLSN